MKNASAALLSFLNNARNRDFPIASADCFTFSLIDGGVFYFTDWDQSISWGGNTFIAGALLVQGMKFKIAVGLEVDRQQLTLSAPPTLMVFGAPWLQAIQDGAFDGCVVQRDRVFMDPGLPNGIDGVTIFKGRVSTVDQVGRTSAQITIASPLVILDYYMPRNLFSPTCVHTLYDSGCQANRTLFAFNGSVGAGSTVSVINGPSTTGQVQGAMIFLTGPNSDLRVTVKTVNAGTSWQLMYPLPYVPLTGDRFTVFDGCDHTLATCTSHFNNAVHFRGFPNVPTPDYAI
jgi:uncharacterized phage protein (TIGR02218 family)